MNLKQRDYRRALWQSLSFLLFPAGWFLLATSIYSLFNLTEIVRLSALVMHAVVFQDLTDGPFRTAGHLFADLINPFFFGVIGSALIVIGKRASVKASSYSDAVDSRQPVVYLRSFSDDRKMARRMLSLGRFFAIKSEEEQLIEALREVGPVFAIGKPRERLPILGASRLYFGDEEWRPQVLDWFGRAALVVIRLPLKPSDGVLWEISSGLSHVEHERLIFLVPRHGSDNLSWLSEILQDENIRPAITPPSRRAVYGSSVSGIVYFSNEGAWNFIRLAKPPLQNRRYTSPLINVYRLALRPIFEAILGQFKPVPKNFGELIATACWLVIIIGVASILVGAYVKAPKKNSFERQLIEFNIRLRQIPDLREKGIISDPPEKVWLSGLEHLSDADLYRYITLFDRILQAAPQQVCVSLAKGQIPQGPGFAGLMNQIAESDHSFLASWFEIQEKILVESVKVSAPAERQTAEIAAKTVAMFLDGIPASERARYQAISNAMMTNSSGASSEDLCWAGRRTFARLREIGETVGSRAARILLF